MRSIDKTSNLTLSFVISFLTFGLALGCGTPAIPPSFGARIINGEEARPNSWPWMVFLTFNSRFHCGGSILDKDTILTAAHCVDFITDISNFKIGVGKHDLSINTQTNIPVSSFHIHPQYNNVTLQNDVAIIKLKSALTFSDRVSPVCLPPPNSHSSLYGKNVVATGWGVTQGGNISTFLQQAQLKVYDETLFYWLFLFGFNIDVSSQQYLVIGNIDRNNSDTNVCLGDSGGPLLYFDGKKWTIFGVTKSVYLDNAKSCLASRASIFQSVPFYLDFINRFLDSASESSPRHSLIDSLISNLPYAF
jgi:secreted trypsin-like serine protease